MSVAAKDGAWLSSTSVQRIECSKCGTVEVTRYPCNEHEVMEKIRAHMSDKHGGGWFG